jgi:hypothetical protein
LIIHQSDLSALSRCAAQYGYQRAGWPDEQNSAAAYGSVIHHCLQVLETLRSQGVDFEVAVRQALETFVHYWHPLNIEAITEPVPADGWLPRQGFSELRARGIDAIRKYADLIRYDDHELLGIEYGFMVPIDGTWDEDLGEPHILAGSVDRLAIRHWKRYPYIAVDDWKTGKDQARLRYNLQFTAYAYASTKREFWIGWGGEDGFGLERGQQLFDKYSDWARKGTWINMRTFKFEDAGWRGPLDYQRFSLAVTQFAATVKADIFPLTISGDACKYCPYRRACGGTGIASPDHGAPGPGGKA